MNENVSMAVVRRLPRYYRYLEELLRSGVNRISSGALSARMGLTASQIRQDLNCFGGFGQQGYGYNVEHLKSEIGRILGADDKKSAIMVGLGYMGHSIVSHIKFDKRGVTIKAIFDIRDEVVGSMVNGIRVYHTDELERICEEIKPEIGILTVPKTEAEKVSERLIRNGVKAFWNFANMDLQMKFPGVYFENVHLGDSLMTLRYRLNDRDKA